ncbi:MAG: hydantoinase B/oxoprolinase family protein, partial [Roseiflexaceae bacterium]
MHRSMSDAIALEVFRHRCSAIAEEMGAALERSAFSANIQERRDYSCALFNAHGLMVAQA